MGKLPERGVEIRRSAVNCKEVSMKTKQLFRVLVSSAAMLAASSAGATDILYMHLDALDIDYVGGVMSLDIKTYSAMSPGVPLNNDDYAPAGNAIVVPLANMYLVPNTAAWDCLGRNTTIYRLLQATSVATQPWVGWNTQDVPNGVFVGNKVQLEVVSVVSAPAGANMAFYTTDSLGTPTSRLNTRSGACSKLSYDGGAGVATQAHVHGFWGFTAPGTYVIRFKATGNLVGGGSVTSGNVDYTFKVQ
jgi:surface-anchored protein